MLSLELSQAQPQPQTREQILTDEKMMFENIAEMVEKYADRSLETSVMLTGLKNQLRSIIAQTDQQLRLGEDRKEPLQKASLE